MRLVFPFQIIIVVVLFFQINKINANGEFYTTIENKTYYLNQDEQYTWEHGLIECLKMNMTLVTIDTIMEEKAINELLGNTDIFSKIPEMWIGGLKISDTRTFIWISTGKPFDNWYHGNPDYTYYCVFIGWKSKTQWTDGLCTRQRGFICEHGITGILQEEHENLKENLKMEMEERKNLQHELNKEKELSANLTKQLQEIETLKEEGNQALGLKNTQILEQDQDQQLESGESNLSNLQVQNKQLQEYQQLISQKEYEKNNRKYFNIIFQNIQNGYFLPNMH